MSVASKYRYDPSAFRAVFEHSFTYLHGIERNARRFASAGAMRDPESGRSWTYAELWRDVERLAGGLSGQGVGPGEVVVFQLYNCPEFVLIWLAAMRLGAVAAPINFRLAAGETAHVLDDSLPRVFVYDAALAAGAEQALELADHEPALSVLVAADGAEPAAKGSLAFRELLDSGESPPSAPELGIYGETTRLYTSGTTGMPKGVSLNSLVEVLSAHDVIMHFPLSPEDRTLNMTPWFHRGGLYSGGPNPSLYVGAEVVPMRQFDPGRCLDLVAELGLTFLIGAPTNLEMLSDAQAAAPRDLSSLRGIVTMGAPLEREACLRYQQLLTPRIFNGYGTTESFWNTFLRPSDLPAHAGSAGRACTDDDVAVARVHEDRPSTPEDLAARDGSEVGEVILRTVKAGYAYVNQPQEQQARFREGWMHTGDMATWDEQGYVTIVGRRDDMLISGGENIHPVQVEEVLNQHPAVADSAVVGLADDRWGELVVAYVVRRDEHLDAGALDAHCREHPMLAGFKRPRAYRFVDQLPMTATGKKIHYRVREQAARDAELGLLVRP